MTQKEMLAGKSLATIGSHLCRSIIRFLKWKGPLLRMERRSFLFKSELKEIWTQSTSGNAPDYIPVLEEEVDEGPCLLRFRVCNSSDEGELICLYKL